MGGKKFALLNERPHNVATYFHGVGCIEHRGGHECAMLSKRKGQRSGKLELGEVVAICDHLCSFGDGKLEEKVGESVCIAPDLLVEPLGRDAVEQSQVRIDHYLLAANNDNPTCYLAADGYL